MPEDQEKSDTTSRIADEVASKVLDALKINQNRVEKIIQVIAELKVAMRTVRKEVDSLVELVKGDSERDPMLTQIRILFERLEEAGKGFDIIKKELKSEIDTVKVKMDKIDDHSAKVEEKKLDIWKIIATAIATLATAAAAALAALKG